MDAGSLLSHLMTFHHLNWEDVQDAVFDIYNEIVAGLKPYDAHVGMKWVVAPPAAKHDRIKRLQQSRIKKLPRRMRTDRLLHNNHCRICME